MIQTQNFSGCRILNFPAVHPCDEISPYTLLSSLTCLARKICSYRSKFFATNKRNARESIRQIGVVLVFLEEIREWDSGLLPGSVVLGFSELHLAFQKVRFLLDDCTREGSRVWMLMNSERVANQFRVLARAIATALDVLPLDLIDAPVDVKDHVELVTRQARKTRFDVDPDDKRVMEVVRSVLSGFEHGFVPDKENLRWVLDYLGIRKWSACNKEVKFLDSEIELENLNDEKKELGLLSSLMGFVCYCRCVLFDVVDDEPSRQSKAKYRSEALIGLNPDDLRCPISLEIMVDPVTVASGHTYDRSSITKWFRAGNSICPKTGERLKNMELVPNSVLRRLIQLYCIENEIPFVDSGHRNRHVTRAVFAGGFVAKKAMKIVADFLSVTLVAGTGVEQNKAAYETRLLSKTSVFNRSCLVEAGVISPLLKLLLYTDSLTQENATAGLLNLSKHSEGKARMVQDGGLELLVHVLTNGLSLEARQHAAGALFYLASVEEYRILIGDNPETVPALMELIKNGTERGQKNALVAIFGLLAHPGNHKRVLVAGTVPLLVNLLMSSDAEDDIVTDSLAILATLAEKSDGTTAILRQGGLDSVVEILNSATSQAGKEYCVYLLLALCRNGGKDVVALLVKSPSLMGSLYSLLSEGTSRASKKAGALIRVLHEFHENRSSGLMAPVLSQERFVHAW